MDRQQNRGSEGRPYGSGTKAVKGTRHQTRELGISEICEGGPSGVSGFGVEKESSEFSLGGG